MKNLPSAQLQRDIESLIESLRPFPTSTQKPVFIALTGLPGTGKSYFTQRLAEKLPLAVLESDALRKALFPQPKYTWWESARLFRACYYLIEELLDSGISVIMDATNLSERNRKKLYNIAEQAKVKFILVKVVAPSKLVKERLEKRISDQLTQSDADWRVYQAMKPKVEKIRLKHYVVDTSKDIEPIINKIVYEVKKGE